jgi:hypothetical protein
MSKSLPVTIQLSELADLGLLKQRLADGSVILEALPVQSTVSNLVDQSMLNQRLQTVTVDNGWVEAFSIANLYKGGSPIWEGVAFPQEVQSLLRKQERDIFNCGKLCIINLFSSMPDEQINDSFVQTRLLAHQRSKFVDIKNQTFSINFVPILFEKSLNHLHCSLDKQMIVKKILFPLNKKTNLLSWEEIIKYTPRETQFLMVIGYVSDSKASSRVLHYVGLNLILGVYYDSGLPPCIAYKLNMRNISVGGLPYPEEVYSISFVDGSKKMINYY